MKKKLIIVINKRKVELDGGTMRINTIVGGLKNISYIVEFRKVRPFFSTILLLRKVIRNKNGYIMFFYPDMPFYPMCHIEFIYFFFIIWFYFIASICKICRNKIVINICSLKREQAKDLQFRNLISDFSLTLLEKMIFFPAEELWFETKKMADYELSLLKIKNKKIRIITNSWLEESKLEKKNKRDSNVIKFIYAGTLTRSRGIYDLINIFLKSNKNIELHLCGKKGSWIEEIKSSKIYYYGNLTEKETTLLANSCDIGIIPHPNRFYYNIIFPAKLAFYIKCNLPIISRSNSETGNIIDKYQIGLTYGDEGELNSIINNILKKDIDFYRKRVKKSKKNFKTSKVLKPFIKDILKNE